MAQHDDEFDEYVEDRPEPVPGGQRLLIIILSVGCLALAVSNVVLAMRVTQLRRLVAERPAVAPGPATNEAVTPSAERAAEAITPSPERAAVASASPVEQSAAPERPAVKPSAEPRAATSAPAADPASPAERPVAPPAPAASIASSASAVPRSAPEPPAPKAKATPAPAPEPPSLDLPPRSGPREQARVAVVTRATDGPVAAPSSAERSTAAWMVHEYGRVDAESRARAVADFYGAHSADGAYWRRVLAEIHATRR